MIDSFVSLVETSWQSASRTRLQQLLDYLYFTSDEKGLFYWYKQKKLFLWAMATAQAAGNYKEE